MLALATACGTQWVRIEGEAMSPTFQDGERALAVLGIDALERGDVVAFRYPKDESKNFIKRIVGLPGEHIASEGGRILIDGQPLAEPYVLDANRSHDSWGPVAIADDAYFMLGDNRINSADSRSYGVVHRAAIWATLAER